jgi:hypothetical protein
VSPFPLHSLVPARAEPESPRESCRIGHCLLQLRDFCVKSLGGLDCFCVQCCYSQSDRVNSLSTRTSCPEIDLAHTATPLQQTGPRTSPRNSGYSLNKSMLSKARRGEWWRCTRTLADAEWTAPTTPALRGPGLSQTGFRPTNQLPLFAHVKPPCEETAGHSCLVLGTGNNWRGSYAAMASGDRGGSKKSTKEPASE